VNPLKIKIPSKKSRQAALVEGFNSNVKGLNSVLLIFQATCFGSCNAACRDWFIGILIFKGLTTRRLYKSFGVKVLMVAFRNFANVPKVKNYSVLLKQL
jgi:hypothetical protein